MNIFGPRKEEDTDDRYWIKKGIYVMHEKIDVPVMVDRIVYQKKKLADGTEKNFTMGVDCHWITKDGSYHKGRFHTKELKKMDE